ncbi:uncharacterized protein LOC135285788 isoform X3 [Passer domesticus]|uniref:uncharacterized protein LOC135285788 isoform X3 n=1 Tax=Passer domesticus TaxID=48849 RepID=UPI0030FF1A3B
MCRKQSFVPSSMAEAALAEAQAVLGTSLHSGLLLDPGTGKKGYELKRILAASLKENLKDLQQVRNSSAEQGSEVLLKMQNPYGLYSSSLLSCSCLPSASL